MIYIERMESCKKFRITKDSMQEGYEGSLDTRDGATKPKLGR